MENDNQKPEGLARYAMRRFVGGLFDSIGRYVIIALLAVGVLFFVYNKYVDPVLSAPGDAAHSASEVVKTGLCKVWFKCEVHDGVRIPDSENPRIIAEEKAEADAKAAKAKAKADEKAAKEAEGDTSILCYIPTFCSSSEETEAVIEPQAEVKLPPLSTPGKPTTEFVFDTNEPEMPDGVVDGDSLTEEEMKAVRDVQEMLYELPEEETPGTQVVEEEKSGWKLPKIFGSDDEPEVQEPEAEGITGVEVFKDVWKKRPEMLGGEKSEE